MSEEGMVARTSGKDCGKQDGDYLSWKNSSWSLLGSAKWTDVAIEDLCRTVSSIQLFTINAISSPQDCKLLCLKLHGKGMMASVKTANLFEKLVDRMGTISSSTMESVVVWLPIHKESSIWLDSNTGKEMTSPLWRTGFPVNDSSKSCALYGSGGEGYINFRCSAQDVSCACHFPQRVILVLRGLCKDSHIDQIYQTQNSPLDGALTYYGNSKAQARFLKDESQWKIKVFVYNTSASSDASDNSFMLGKYNWTIEGDSVKCNKGKTYTKALKLTGCKDGQFTCDDGQCIKMKERCNQVPDCRDESDENGCQLIIFRNNYNKNIPPIGRTIDGSSVPAQVSISITLMKVVEIEETDHSIHLQFRINLQWKENRVKYQNLKEETSLNALTNSDISKLWLPLVMYDNTDQKQSTRLGEYGNGEWITRLTVAREGNFTRSDFDQADEAEIFEGKENTLKMTQTYTHEFQCKYKLQQYPFDTQVLFELQN